MQPGPADDCLVNMMILMFKQQRLAGDHMLKEVVLVPVPNAILREHLSCILRELVQHLERRQREVIGCPFQWCIQLHPIGPDSLVSTLL